MIDSGQYVITSHLLISHHTTLLHRTLHAMSQHITPYITPLHCTLHIFTHVRTFRCVAGQYLQGVEELGDVTVSGIRLDRSIHQGISLV